MDPMLRGLLAFIICVVTGGACAAPAAAQDALPARLAGWESADVLRATPAALAGFTGEDSAALLREYGILGSERRSYARGGESLRLTLHRMADPTAAYGGFTLLRAPQMAAGDWSRYAAEDAGAAVIVVGQFLLEVEGRAGAARREAVTEMVARLREQADHTPFPPFADYLPDRGRIPQADFYIRGPRALARALPQIEGDWIGFSDGAEAQLARYRRGGRDLTVLLAAYPTPQIAMARLRGLEERFQVNAQGSGGARTALTVRRQGPLLLIAIEPPSAQAAGEIFDELRYAASITWNEPTDYLTGPNIGEIVLTAFLGIGLLLALALVFGLGLGGIRLIVKKFFPGRVFDPVNTVEILQLGISSKPIDAQDFYIPGDKQK